MRTSQLARLASLFLGVFLALVLFTPSSKADTTTYTYTGNAVNQFGGGAACPPECNLTISFTLATALGPDANEVGVIPMSFDLKDGVSTITEISATSFSFGFFTTNSSGDIIGWNIDAITPIVSMFSGTAPPGCAGCTVVDLSGTATSFAKLADDPGTWTVSTPEPSSFFMLGIGVIALFGFGLKKAVMQADN
jgi:hypothetical protein